jgi:hypothetical protein
VATDAEAVTVMTDAEAVTVTAAHEDAEEEPESALEEEEPVVDERLNPEEELEVLVLDNAEEVLVALLELELVIGPVVLVLDDEEVLVALLELELVIGPVVLVALLELEPVVVPVVLGERFETGVATRLPQTMFMETGREVAYTVGLLRVLAIDEA